MASAVHAELTQRGDLFVSFSGGLTPGALPRNTLAPITVHVAGTIRTLSGNRPPALRQITIALGRGGHLDTRGLPVCHLRQIQANSDDQALAACGTALVGEGSYLARTAFPEQSAFPSKGHILAFNSIVDGRRAILAHIYGREPASTSRLVAFHISSTAGAYGTLLRGALPASLNPYGYVRRISLSLHRNFTYRGRPRSYLSAACRAPEGFQGAVFPFARASMTFANGRTLSSTLTRSCMVRG